MIIIVFVFDVIFIYAIIINIAFIVVTTLIVAYYYYYYC